MSPANFLPPLKSHWPNVHRPKVRRPYVHQPNVSDSTVLPPLANNDHCTIHLKVLFKVDPPKCFRRQVWDFSAADV